MIRPAIALLALASALAACHSPREQAASNSAAAAPSGQFANQLAALPEAQRNGAFMRAITDAGFPCQKIEHATAHAPIGGKPAWAIGCDHGNDYVALVIPGDALQIIPGRPADAS
ncbi:MAG: hypothetical protein ACTHM0_04040 [Sphingomonas sp.]